VKNLRLLRLIPSVLLAIVAGDVVAESASSGGARIMGASTQLWDLGLPSGGYVLAGFAVVAGAALALTAAWIGTALVQRHAPAHAMGFTGSRDLQLGWDPPGSHPFAEPVPGAFLAPADEGGELLLRLQRAIAMNPVLMPERASGA
jgi:hypothetical protein